MTDHTKLDEFIAQLCANGLTYNAVFVPQSASRNSAEKHKSLNWRIALANAKGARLDTDYMQGIGHVPGYCHARTTYEQKQLHAEQERASELGTYPARKFSTVSRDVVGALPAYEWRPAKPENYKYGHSAPVAKRLPVPTLRDVLHSLVLDAQGIENACGFEDWASNYGYDEDSREAERTYNACKEIAYSLQRLIGAANISKLAELFQDY